MAAVIIKISMLSRWQNFDFKRQTHESLLISYSLFINSHPTTRPCRYEPRRMQADVRGTFRAVAEAARGQSREGGNRLQSGRHRIRKQG